MICQGKGIKLLLSKSCLGLNVGHRDFVLFVCDALLTFGATFCHFHCPGLDVSSSCRLIESLILEFGLHILVFIWNLLESLFFQVFVLMRERACRGTQRRSCGSHWILGGQAWKRRDQRRSCWSLPATLGSSSIPPFQLMLRPGMTIFVSAQEKSILNHLFLWRATSTSLITWSWRCWVTNWANRVFFNGSISNHAVA